MLQKTSVRLEEGLQEKTSGHTCLRRGKFNPTAGPQGSLEAATGLSKLGTRSRVMGEDGAGGRQR